MNFNKHLEIRGKHALFNPSQSSWINYDDDAVDNRIISQYRKDIGTNIHEFVATEIELGHSYGATKYVIDGVETYIYKKHQYTDPATGEVRISIYGRELLNSLHYAKKETWETVRAYINDACGFHMVPEQPLKYSEAVFGTADTIIFRDNVLRIHDLKTGSVAAHIEQLICYAALFCLEYKKDPRKIDIELRVYQNGEVNVTKPVAEDVEVFIDKIIAINKRYVKFKKLADKE